VFTLQDPTAFSHCNDPLHKLRWDRNGSTGQAPLLELKSVSRYDQGLFNFEMNLEPWTSNLGRTLRFKKKIPLLEAKFLSPLAEVTP